MTAEQIKQLDAIKEGTRVTVGYTQRPVLAVCQIYGRWVPRSGARDGYMILGTIGNAGNILLSDNVVVIKNGRKIHIRVDLDGRRIVKSHITLDVIVAITKEP
jgi:hypothetical protein